jgi:single-strand DNA-binding protein
MQTIIVTGRIGANAELRTTQSAQNVCSFSVASDQGFGDKKTTNWFRVSLWGKRGQSLAPYLLKGGIVTISGELEVGEWEGKTQLNINANDIALQGGGKPSAASERKDDFAADLNDDVPFN